jgi:hypothetical protein
VPVRLKDASTLSRDFTPLSASTTTAAGYEATFASIGLQQHLNTFNADYEALVENLRSY